MVASYHEVITKQISLSFKGHIICHKTFVAIWI